MNRAPPEPQSNETTAYASSSEGSRFSLHLASFKYFDFNKVSRSFDQCKKGIRLQRGIQTTEKKYHLTELKERKESEKMGNCERDLPVFSNTSTKPLISVT